MHSTEEIIIHIKNKNMLEDLIADMNKGKKFVDPFVFDSESLKISFLQNFGIDHNNFVQSFYFDKNTNIHISESVFGYIWVSTLGLITSRKLSDNSYVNACISQCSLLKIIIEKQIILVSSNDVYNINSPSYSQLTELSISFYHNVVFYLELFIKAYLSLNNVPFNKNHNLRVLFDVVEKFIADNQSIHPVLNIIIDNFKSVLEHIESAKDKSSKPLIIEHFIKYDDNPSDTTILQYDINSLNSTLKTIEVSGDFIIIEAGI